MRAARTKQTSTEDELASTHVLRLDDAERMVREVRGSRTILWDAFRSPPMNTVDQLIHGFDGLLRTVARVKPQAQNRSPAEGALDEPLTADEKNSRET